MIENRSGVLSIVNVTMFPLSYFANRYNSGGKKMEIQFPSCMRRVISCIPCKCRKRKRNDTTRIVVDGTIVKQDDAFLHAVSQTANATDSEVTESCTEHKTRRWIVLTWDRRRRAEQVDGKGPIHSAFTLMYVITARRW